MTKPTFEQTIYSHLEICEAILTAISTNIHKAYEYPQNVEVYLRKALDNLSMSKKSIELSISEDD